LSIWSGYGGGTENEYNHGFFSQSNPEWAGYHNEDQFRGVSIDLYDSGKMHQPRKFGARPRRLPYYWLETIVDDAELANSPTVKDAWDKFQMVSGLRGTQLKAHNE
jgi:hypothetical protein